LPQHLLVAGVTVNTVDQEQEFASAVVLRHGIRAAAIDAARHLAVRELVLRVPQQEFLRVLLVTEPQQHFGSHRAVADPRTLVRPRSGLDGRTVAVDQHVGERRAQRVSERLILRGNSELDAVQFLAPFCGDRIERRGRARDSDLFLAQRLLCVLRQVEHELLALTRLQIHVVNQSPGGEATVITHAMTAGTCRQPVARSIGRERDGAERFGRSDRIDRWLSVDGNDAIVECEVLNRTHAALGVEELRRRIDLERPNDKRQRHLLVTMRRIVQPVNAV
jgi:hypothetical protein